MSMPCFPKFGTDITREQALNMILASIAMEELGLSHIINAEGEKLQYVLGTLEGQDDCCICTNVEDILAVNRSITALLEMVMQNQLLLKGKMERVLNEYKTLPECYGENTCKVDPGDKKKCNLLLINAYPKYLWKRGNFFPWKACSQVGKKITWNCEEPDAIMLNPSDQYWISFSITIQISARVNEVDIALQALTGNGCHELIPFHYSIHEKNKGKFILSGSMSIPQCIEGLEVRKVAFVAWVPDSIYVEQAVCNIFN